MVTLQQQGTPQVSPVPVTPQWSIPTPVPPIVIAQAMPSAVTPIGAQVEDKI